MDRWISTVTSVVKRMRGTFGPDALLRLSVGRGNCLRFARSRVTQNTSFEFVRAELCAGRKEKQGWRLATVSSMGPDVLPLVERAEAELESAGLDSDFLGFVPPGLDYDFVQTWDSSVAELDPEGKARALASLASSMEGWELAGVWETAEELEVLASSNGLFLHSWNTKEEYDVRFDDCRGGVFSFRRAGRRSPDFLGRADLELKLRMYRDSRPASPRDGEYMCVLAPDAVSEIVFFLAFLGFGGREYRRGSSFTAGKLGDRLLDDSPVVLRDDALAPDTLCRWYDRWGAPRRPLVLLDHGVMRGVATDVFTASSLREVTGHSGAWGPYPDVMEIEAGGVGLDELLRGDDCLWIERFHYPTVADPNAPLIKGTTKDGTYMLRAKGKSLRMEGLEFVMDPLRVLGLVRAVSRERRVVPQGSLAFPMEGANKVPWLLVGPVRVEGGRLLAP